MESKYFVSIRPGKDGSRTIHKEDCPFLPEPGKRIFLGIFQSSFKAMEEGEKYCTAPASCTFCSNEHHRENRMRELHEILADPCFISYGQLNIIPLSILLCSVN